MRWEPPEHEHGLPVLAYHLQYALSLPHSKQPPPWQSGPQVANTCCQVSAHSHVPISLSACKLGTGLSASCGCPASQLMLPAAPGPCTMVSWQNADV